jgi:hypothetical protein
VRIDSLSSVAVAVAVAVAAIHSVSLSSPTLSSYLSLRISLNYWLLYYSYSPIIVLSNFALRYLCLLVVMAFQTIRSLRPPASLARIGKCVYVYRRRPRFLLPFSHGTGMKQVGFLFQ